MPPLHLERGVAEYQSSFDTFQGERSNIDLMLYARSAIIAIEAKADEPFAATVKKKLEEAHRRPRTNFPMRLSALVDALFPALPNTLDDMGYQLLSGTAGVIAEAGREGVDCAVFVVHEFQSRMCSQKRLAVNQEQLTTFANCVGVMGERLWCK